MKYADLKENDIVNGQGVCVSFWVQGCPHRCYGCHNPETWEFTNGKEFTPEVLTQIKKALIVNGVQRNFSILGGEPLCLENLFLTELVIREIRKDFPNIKIYVWTGYVYEQLKKSSNKSLKYILSTIDFLIDGPYIEEQRDITLPMRGSRNQRIIDLKEKI